MANRYTTILISRRVIAITKHELPGPLSGIRVLELADENGEFCGKLMADLGADVIKVEPPSGQLTRRIGPFLDDVFNPNHSLHFWHYNTSKRGVTLNLETSQGKALFETLAKTTDVIVESYSPGYLRSLGLDYHELLSCKPDLIICSITPFGQTGPWSMYQTSDLMHMAAGGQMASSGYDEEDVPDAPPIAPGGGNSWHMGSHFAYMAIMAALHYRNVSGKGQHIDISIHEACHLTTEAAVPSYIYKGDVVQRRTGRHHSPDPSFQTQIKTSDGGWVQTTGSGGNPTPRKLRSLAEWMDTYGAAEDLLDEKYLDPGTFNSNLPHINEVIANFISQIPREVAWRGGQERGYPWGAIRTLDEILEDEHLKARGFFTNVIHRELDRTFTYPASPAIYNGSTWLISRRAPLVGEHNVEVFCTELGVPNKEYSTMHNNGII